MRQLLPFGPAPRSFVGSVRCAMAPERPSETNIVGHYVDIDILTVTCSRLAARAGECIRAVHAKRVAGETLHVEYKDTNDTRSALTEADEAAQAAIVPELRARFPGIAVIGEEDELEKTASLNGWDVTNEVPKMKTVAGKVPAADVAVFVDPLDGTREFVRGNLAAVQTLAGVCIRGRPVAGVVGLPFAPDAPVLVGAVGSGVIGLEHSGTPLARTGEGAVLVASAGAKGHVAAVQSVIDAEYVLEMGGAGNKMLHLARGDADVAVLNLATSLWDTAATSALVVAAGGTVTDFFGGPLPHAAGSLIENSLGVVATGPHFSQRDARRRTHRQLCEDIRAAMVADVLLARAGFAEAKFPQASDVARDLDGAILSVKLLQKTVSANVIAFTAPEQFAVRYLMSEACRLELTLSQGADKQSETPTSIFLKRVVMEDLPHVALKARTAPAKLARDVTSYQVEAAFLESHACARLVHAGVHIARPFHVEQRPAPTGAPAIQSRFLLLLEDFSPQDRWAQHGLLDAMQTRACLAALAEMHAFFWKFAEDPDAAQLNNSVWEQASYWLPSRQAPDSFEKLPRCWKTQLTAFEEPLAQIRDDRHAFPLEDLAKVLQRHAPRAANRIHGVGLDKKSSFRTIVHGDAKAANFFLRESGDNWEVGMIDFQWCGWGHPALDVAYLIATSSAPVVLSPDGSAELDLLKFYHTKLVDGFLRFEKARDRDEAERLISLEELHKYYNDAFIDLVRLVISYHWDRIKASPAVLASRKNSIGSNSYNKNVECAIWFIRRAWALLSDLEQRGDARNDTLSD